MLPECNFKNELNKLLEEINNRKKDLIRLQEDINILKDQKENKEIEILKLDKEIISLTIKAVKIRASDFLRTTIGEENYIFYLTNGFLDIVGTNNSIYRITNDGKILKMKMVKNDFRNKIKNIKIRLSLLLNSNQKEKTKIWEGNIRNIDYPLEDAIAIVYMHIIKDSNRFDMDKGCGSIYIKSL